jgi:hypothetical protein
MHCWFLGRPCALIVLLAILPQGSMAQAPPWRPLAEELSAGIKAFEAVFEGPVHAYLVTADLGMKGLELRPIVSSKPAGKEPLTSLAASSGALVAVNASFFDMQASPTKTLGWLVLDGKTLADPISAVTQSKVRYPVARAAIVWKAADPPFLAWARTTKDAVVLLDAPIKNENGKPAAAPASGFAGSPAKDVRHALAAGPMLLKDGRPSVTRVEERMFVSDRKHPRTAFGQNGNRIFLLVVEGRSGDSVGVTLDELMAMLKDLGATDAMNLDGGGSTTLVIRNRLVNRPLGGKAERSVPTGLGLFHRN